MNCFNSFNFQQTHLTISKIILTGSYTNIANTINHQRIITFTGNGTIYLPEDNICNILLVGGGGGGGGVSYLVKQGAGGGGAGGFGYGSLTLKSAITYSITIGDGGKGAINSSKTVAKNGSNSLIVGGTISETAYGGGAGSSSFTSPYTGFNGGSGGGVCPLAAASGGIATKGSGILTYLGNNGGRGVWGQQFGGSGGGGADLSGSSILILTSKGNGGSGHMWIDNATYAGGGGGGGGSSSNVGSGGTGGGGAGGGSDSGSSGTVNSGGGGGGTYYGSVSGASSWVGGSGGSGVCKIIFNTFPTDNMIFYYKFDTIDLNTTVISGITRAIFANYAPYNNGNIINYNATGVNNTYYSIDTTTKKFGDGSLYINSRSGYISITGGFSVPSSTTGWTHCIWYKATFNQNDSIIGNYTNSTLYAIQVGSGTTIKITMPTIYGSTSVNFTPPSGINPWDTNWHHLAFVVSATTGYWTIYLDNIGYSSANPRNGTWSTNPGSSLATGQYSGSLIGSGASGTAIGYYDDMMLYSRELSATEINAIYNG